jgi:hypothetical protein
MASVSAGLVAVVVAAIPALLAAGGLGFALSLVAVLSLSLRAWSYRFVAEVLPLAAGAGAGLLAVEAAAALRLLDGGADPAELAIVLAGAGLALAGLSAVGAALPAPSRPPRAAWLVVDVLLLPLTLGALGVFDATARIAHHLVPA